MGTQCTPLALQCNRGKENNTNIEENTDSGRRQAKYERKGYEKERKKKSQ